MPLLRFELRTSRLLSARSNQLSYRGGGTRWCPGPHKIHAETDRFQHGPATALWGGAGQVRVFAHLCAGLLLGEFVLLLLSLSLCLSLALPRSLPLSCTATNRWTRRADAEEEGWCWATHQGQGGLVQGADKARTGQGLPCARRLPARWGTQTCEDRTMHAARWAPRAADSRAPCRMRRSSRCVGSGATRRMRPTRSSSG